MLRIGLTGGVASGKSTAARFFKRLGAKVFDADRIVGDLYGSGKAGYRAVARLFGRDYVVPGIGVDKARLSAKVFQDPRSRKRLEAAIHPLVIREIRRGFREARLEGARVAIAEASQIFESGYEKEFDLIIAVVAPLKYRRNRWKTKGLAPSDFSRRAALQLAPKNARKRASFVLWNRGTRAALDRGVRDLYARIVAAAAKRPLRSPRRSTLPSTRRRSSIATARGVGVSRRKGPPEP
jgi:dephospho-CoA kinase